MKRNLHEFLNAIDKKDTTIILNSNVVNARRLLNFPVNKQIDCIYASLHTVENDFFKDYLAMPNGATQVMENILALKEHGYGVSINYSLGNYNIGEFEKVMTWTMNHGVDFKAITVCAGNDDGRDWYDGENWTDPDKHCYDVVTKLGGELVQRKEGFGERSLVFKNPKFEDL